MDVWYNGKYGVSFYAYGTELNPIPEGSFLGHTWKTWGLVPEARPFFPPPQRKRSELESNGINGKIDISKSLIGIPLYENREASWKFFVTDFLDRTTNIQDSNNANILDNVNDPIQASILQTFPEKYTQLLTMLNGREVAIVLDEDPNYFYKGFVDVDTWESPNDDNLNGITLRCDVFPYKIKKEMTVLDLIPNRTFGQEITFDPGAMPFVPYIKVGYTMNSGRIFVRVGFTNQEIELNYPIPTTQLNTQIKIPPPAIEGVYVGYRQLVATYREPTGYTNNAKPTFLCSNYYGHNRCSITVNVSDASIGSNFSFIYLVYREGCL